MREIRKTGLVLAVGVGVCVGVAAAPAQARCVIMSAGHNGTDLFNGPGGARKVATNKLYAAIEDFKQSRRLRRIRVGRVRTSCGKWFTKYLLPHRHCRARARVCY